MSVTELHAVSELEGIGPARAAALAERSIHYAEQMLLFEPWVMADWLASIRGLTHENIVNSLIPQARLMRIAGVDGSIRR